jgi:hypothetical protein
MATDRAETELNREIAIVRKKFDNGTPALPAFDYLLAQARAAAFRLVPRSRGKVLSVEIQLPDRRRNYFSAQAHARHVNFYLRSPALEADAGLFTAAEARFGAVEPNRRGEYRTHLHDQDEVDAMLALLRTRGGWPSHRHDRRFVATTYRPLNGEHLLNAARLLAEGHASHDFGPSTRYDVLFEGERLPPKALFGLAASAALGFRVRPENFTAGEGTICFRTLLRHGYPIIDKKGVEPGDLRGLTEEDRAWSEGDPRLVQHLRRERGTGLAAAKRSQFKAKHGHLYCERCEMDPVERYGSSVGEACIEVHHRAKPVAAMDAGHQTRLEDLECLCANCHRVTNRELRNAILQA